MATLGPACDRAGETERELVGGRLEEMAPEGGFSSFVTWRRIRARAGLDDVRIHDLRLTYDSNAVMSGLSIPILGKILGHAQMQTTMRYAHFADDPVQQAAAQVAETLSGQIAPVSTRARLVVV
jgi:integrase